MDTAKLPEGFKTNKYREITPDPADLKTLAHVVTVKPASGVVLVHDVKGGIVARYFDEGFAREEFKAAGLDFEKMKAGAVLKEEQIQRVAVKRAQAQPDRRLRRDRKQQRESTAAATAEKEKE